MTELPQPPYPHSLRKITQDPDKPEVYWLEFRGSQSPYAVPANIEGIINTHQFLTNWLERHHETEGPWTNWNWAQRPDGSRPPWVQEAQDPREDD
jgi:hypothetical protein